MPGGELGTPLLPNLVERLEPFLPVRAQRLREGFRHDEVPVPLGVGGNHDPRSMGQRAARDRILVRLGEVAPLVALLPVLDVDLPGRYRILFPLEETLLLLVLRDVEEVLEDDAAVLCEQRFEGVDRVVARLPDRLLHQLVHPDDQDVLVMGPVEDGELPLPRRYPVDAPEEVMLSLLGRGHAEGHHLDASGIEPAHDMLDGAVLPRGIAPLQDEQDAVCLRAPQQVLELEKLLVERFETLLGLRLRHLRRRVGGDRIQAHLRARLVEHAGLGHGGNLTRLFLSG